jgi:hypothetical protein
MHLRSRDSPTCPTCRKPTEYSKCYIIFLGEDSVDKQYVEGRLNETNLLMESIITEQNRIMKKEFLELKEMVATAQFGQAISETEGQLKDQLRAKDNTIANLRKEIYDLKVQRAETAKNMTEIQKEVSDLKNRQLGGAARAPLGQKSENKAPITLSLKFGDDFKNMDKADRL